MSDLHPADAFEILRFLSTFHARLSAAQEGLARRRQADREKSWLSGALALVSERAEASAALLEQARALPELQASVAEVAAEDQARWVEALERLVAGITFHAGSRAPLIEALFPHQKWGSLRRASREEAGKYAAELDRRARSGYATRMLGQEEYAFAKPVLEQIAQAHARWMAHFAPSAVREPELPKVRQALADAAEAADVAIREAKLLAEAALLRWDGAFEEAGLQAKPRKRATKVQPKAEGKPAAEPNAEPEAKPEAKAEPKNGAQPPVKRAKKVQKKGAKPARRAPPAEA